MANRSAVLVILDGFGIAPAGGGNAITAAHAPFLHGLEREPHPLLQAAGEAVGLAPGEPGNSEVGHLNLGAGRVVLQESERINSMLADRTFFTNPILRDTCQRVARGQRTLHLAGLLSPVAIHAVYAHLLGLLELAKTSGVQQVKLHLMTDGRDSGQRDALRLLLRLEHDLGQLGLGEIATVTGRYFAMDRDNHWDRTTMALQAITLGVGASADSARLAISGAYAANLTDEFIPPTAVRQANGEMYAGFQNSDEVIIWNCRADRARQLVRLLSQKDEQTQHGLAQADQPPTMRVTTLVPYGTPEELPGVMAAIQPPRLKNTLAEFLAAHGDHQFHIAETEKWAHTTYFFNGRVETAFPLEERSLIPSPAVPTYDTAPAMRAAAITAEVVARIHRRRDRLIVANFANADMVGHTGNFRAAVTAVESLNQSLEAISAASQKQAMPLVITADHGNIEEMVHPRTGEVATEHTTNPVPCYFVLPEPLPLLKTQGRLADIAPTILALLGYQPPPEMTGSSLLEVSQPDRSAKQPSVILDHKERRD